MSNVQPKLILREKWLAALEDPASRQLCGKFGSFDIPDDPVCALGLAARVAGVKHYTFDGLLLELVNAYGFRTTALVKIIRINDYLAWTFPMIAKWVRDNPHEVWL